MLTEPIRVLRPEDMERIHQAALSILQRVGMKIDSPKAHALLAKAGCSCDLASGVVRFPSRLVQQSVDQMRLAYDQPQRLPERMAARYAHIRFRREKHRIHRDFTASAGGFCVFICDFEGQRRKATMDDVRRAIHMVNRLDDINLTGLPVADQDTPPAIRPVVMAAELAKRTTKLGGVETFRKEDIPYLLEIGAIVQGGEEALRRAPVLIGYGEARSPLCFDRNMVEIFMEYIERGYPQTLDTMPNGGATAPITAAGILAQGSAETLAAVVLAHAIDPQAVVGVDIIPSYSDMRSGLFSYGTPARLPLLVGRVQMISEFYGCPSGVHGAKTDSCFVDVQAGAEKAWSTLVPVLAGAVGIGTAGHLENAVTFSPQQLVIDNEIVRGVRRVIQPIEVNDETLAVDAIAEVGAGGNFLAEPHTAGHFRAELMLSELFCGMPWAAAHADGRTGLAGRALEQARAIWAEDPPVILDDAKVRAIDEVVARARRDLA